MYCCLSNYLIFQIIYSWTYIIQNYFEHFKTGFIVKKSFCPEGCPCSWNTRGPLVHGPLSSVLHGFVREGLSYLLLEYTGLISSFDVVCWNSPHKDVKDSAKLKACLYGLTRQKVSKKTKKNPSFVVLILGNLFVCANKKFMELDSKSVLYLFQEPQTIINTHNLGSNINNWLKTPKPTLNCFTTQPPYWGCMLSLVSKGLNCSCLKTKNDTPRLSN